MTPVLELSEVTRRYSQADGSELTVLDSVSLAIEPGETVSIAGRSGSGKSTLLHVAAGIEVPSEGAVRLGGRDLAGLPDAERSRLRGRSVGLVFQFFHLVPYLTVRENVLLPARIARVREVRGTKGDPREVDAAADRLLAAVGLEGRAREPARRLSGGEMQRTAIARALLLRPALLLADEPTGNLDARGAGAVADLLFRLVRDRGAGLLLATHDPELAARADTRLRLRGGRLFADERPPSSGVR
ncbi:MAG: ATP-binding cassette domain-containing protein [Acidobacteriota bacterium]|nr:ATP-binding cassette domain-containing protein [Acidobacteriota bacterium]